MNITYISYKGDEFQTTGSVNEIKTYIVSSYMKGTLKNYIIILSGSSVL